MQEDTKRCNEAGPSLADKERTLSAWEAAIDARWRRIAAKMAAIAASGCSSAEVSALLADARQRNIAAGDLRSRLVEQRTTHAHILDAYAGEAEVVLERARLVAIPQRPVAPPYPAPTRQAASSITTVASPIEAVLTSTEGSAPPDADTLRPASARGAASQPEKPVATGIERRGNRRVALDVDVTLASETNFFVGFAENISEGGLFIATHQLLPVGATVDVTFRLPAVEPIHAKAVVMWVRQFNSNSDTWPGMGVSFVGMSDADRRAVDAFLRVRDPLFFA